MMPLEFGPDVRTVDRNCPFCNKVVNAHTEVCGKGKPQEGNISVCLGCLELSIFTADLSLRKPTNMELFDIHLEMGGELAILRRAMAAAKEKGL